MSNLLNYVILSILLCWFFERNAYHDQQERAGYKIFSHNWKERPRRANSLEKHNYARFIPQIGQDMRQNKNNILAERNHRDQSNIPAPNSLRRNPK